MERYIIREHFRDGSVYDRMKANTKEEAVEILREWLGWIEIINGHYYGRRAMCCGVRPYYTIDEI